MYSVLKPTEMFLGLGLELGSWVEFEEGWLTLKFTRQYSKEDLDKEIELLASIVDPESRQQPQHCLDAIKFLEDLKFKLGWQ